MKLVLELVWMAVGLALFRVTFRYDAMFERWRAADIAFRRFRDTNPVIALVAALEIGGRNWDEAPTIRRAIRAEVLALRHFFRRRPRPDVEAEIRDHLAEDIARSGERAAMGLTPPSDPPTR